MITLHSPCNSALRLDGASIYGFFRIFGQKMLDLLVYNIIQKFNYYLVDLTAKNNFPHTEFSIFASWIIYKKSNKKKNGY